MKFKENSIEHIYERGPKKGQVIEMPWNGDEYDRDRQLEIYDVRFAAFITVGTVIVAVVVIVKILEALL